jgi:hypothetical protein
MTAAGRNFPAGSLVVPAEQAQFKLVKSIFEKNTKFEDSLFYDISAWTIPLAMGVPYAELTAWNPSIAGERVTDTEARRETPVRSDYAYILHWKDYLAPQALYRLQSRGVLTKVATRGFESAVGNGSASFGYGDILIPVGNQSMDADALHRLLTEVAGSTGARFTAVGSGLSTGGIDLGSGSFLTVRQPNVMVFCGSGTSATDVGEMWHLFDQRYRIPASLVDVEQFNRIDAARYNVIVMSSGSYGSLSKDGQEKLRNWVSAGGTLIGIEDAVSWLASNGFTRVQFRKDGYKEDSVSVRPYEYRVQDRRATDMPGSIFEARLEPTHPIAFGHTDTLISLFKSNNLFMEKNRSPYTTPVRFTERPLQAGYLHSRFRKIAPNAAAVNIDPLGRGRVVSMTENPNFRAFWLGTNRLLLNAVFFGSVMEAR